jgi:hypothetical protein
MIFIFLFKIKKNIDIKYINIFKVKQYFIIMIYINLFKTNINIVSIILYKI